MHIRDGAAVVERASPSTQALVTEAGVEPITLLVTSPSTPSFTYTHPGDNPGAKKRFLWSTPFQMLPPGGSI